MFDHEPLPSASDITPAYSFYHAMKAVEHHNQRYIVFMANQEQAQSASSISVEDELQFMHIAHGDALRTVGVDLLQHQPAKEFGAITLRPTLVDAEKFRLFLHNASFQSELPDLHDSIATVVDDGIAQLELLNYIESPLLQSTARQLITLEPEMVRSGMSRSRQVAELRAISTANTSGILPEFLTARSLGLLPILNDELVTPNTWHTQGTAQDLYLQWAEVTHFLRSLTGKIHTQAFLKELLAVTTDYLRQSEADWYVIGQFRRKSDQDAYLQVFKAIKSDLYEIATAVSHV